MEIQLKELYLKQLELDKAIQENHNCDYKSTRYKRFLAFQVELNELANATRCFKFWSNKEGESKARLLDEFADGMHFILSIGIDFGYQVESVDIVHLEDDLTMGFLLCNKLFVDFMEKQDFDSYIEFLTYFFSLSTIFGYNPNELVEAYFLKLGVNYQRQDNNY